MNESRSLESTVFALSISVIVALVAGALAAFSGYRLGYQQARTEAQVELARKDKALAAARTKARQADDDQGKGKDKRDDDKPPILEETSYTADDLEIPGLDDLAGEAQARVVSALNTTMGACEACSDYGMSTAKCLTTRSMCENMPRLAKRAVRMAREGATLEEIKEAITYKEPWVKIDLSGAPTLGSEDAPVTIVEYSEFQCPFCRRSQKTIQELKEKYGDKLRWAFLNFPLSRHDQAKPAAAACLAAGRQGRFWEYHDLLFEHQKDLRKEGIFEEIAQELELDMEQFNRDRESDEIEEQIKRDLLQSRKVGVRGTPTFFVNGYRLRGAQPTVYFERIIDLELEDAANP